ncbi:TrbI/VirB10 family protein [Paracoccus laeviglucosivorans]|uniref:Type IV secretion system protein VirB10 n=1 Tax=Paracoccus laeviglucosivorans TaxID=1197861 RepID=A0A521FSG6_9RHOB|nr:TrbI/VirB10 family protein [Paracoccus laeviglucosivorans]SMO99163.1 type IV secretion system protein VirB10 [Paracoccus laeviglucosivorans]
MSETQDDKVRQRLARLKQPEQPSRRLHSYIVPVATLVLGLALGIYVMLPRDKTPPATTGLPTSTVTEFQQEPGLAAFTTTRAEPAPAAAPDAAPAPDPKLAELTARLAAMERDHQAAQAQLQEERDAARREAGEKDTALAEAAEEQRRLETELLNAAQLDLPDPAAAEEEARRLADLEARRQEAADLRQRRITSPIVAFSAGGGGPNSDAAANGEADTASAPDFLRAGAARAGITRAEILANPGQTIVQGTMIEAVLETAVDSSLPGNVAATVSQDVWSMDMSQVLIPRGAKLYGRYAAEIEPGQRRVMIAWDRILRADGMTVALEGYGTDPVGRAGLSGRVNNHTLSRFGAAAMVSVIGALPAVLEAAASGDEDGDDKDDPGQLYAGIGQSASGALGNTMAGIINRSPTITIPQGQVVVVRVNRDMEIF